MVQSSLRRRDVWVSLPSRIEHRGLKGTMLLIVDPVEVREEGEVDVLDLVEFAVRIWQIYFNDGGWKMCEAIAIRKVVGEEVEVNSTRNLRGKFVRCASLTLAIRLSCNFTKFGKGDGLNEKMTSAEVLSIADGGMRLNYFSVMFGLEGATNTLFRYAEGCSISIPLKRDRQSVR